MKLLLKVDYAVGGLQCVALRYTWLHYDKSYNCSASLAAYSIFGFIS